MQLTADQEDAVRAIYHGLDAPHAISVAKDLGAYLSLLHIIGPEGLPGKAILHFGVDSFTVWRAAPVALEEHLQRDGETIACKELGTKSSTAA